MKKLLTIILSVAIITAIALSSCAAPSAPSAKTLKIGLVWWLGNDIGLEASQGIELFAEEDNKNGGIDIGGEKYKVELIKYDSNNSQSTEVAAINRLIFEDKVNYLCVQGGYQGAWLKTTEDNKVVVMSVDPLAAVNLAAWTRYSFNPAFIGSELVAKTGWFCRTYPELTKRVVLGAVDNQFGHMTAQLSSDQFKAFGVNVEVIFFPASQTDLSSVGTKIASLQPTMMNQSTGSSAVDGLLLNAVYQAGYRGVRFLGTNNAITTWLKVATPEALEGMITGVYATETDPALTKTAQHFKDLWKAKYGKWTDPLSFGVGTYSCLKAALMKAGTTDAVKVSEVIASGLEFSSPTGDGKMISRPDLGNNRAVDSVCDYYMKKITKGKAEIIATIKADDAVKLMQIAYPPLPPGALPPVPGGPPPGASGPPPGAK